MSELAIAAVLAAAILAASTISVEMGISVALFELALGVVVGNAFDLAPGRSARPGPSLGERLRHRHAPRLDRGRRGLSTTTRRAARLLTVALGSAPVTRQEESA